MADRFATIKRFFEVTASTVASPGPQGRSSLRGKDFMRDDLTYGADRAEY